MRSLEDTLTVARFVLSDRKAREFSRLGSEQEFRDFVRERFWSEERQQGGWDNPKVYATVRRNPLDVASASRG
jgi:hypothetical protein